jgi:hypothetical protein
MHPTLDLLQFHPVVQVPHPPARRPRPELCHQVLL